MIKKCEIGQPPIAIYIRENRRAKRFNLRVSQKDGEIYLTLPRWRLLDEGLAFAQTQERWIRTHKARLPEQTAPGIDGQVWLDGREFHITPYRGRGVEIDGDQIKIPGDPAHFVGKLRGFYKTLARDRFAPLARHYAQILNAEVAAISLRDTRSRWGSCSSDGRLMFSWRLVMAPPSVQDYVVVHEACHLREMNHSAQFWALVAELCPNYQVEKHWLRQNGARLHQLQL